MPLFPAEWDSWALVKHFALPSRHLRWLSCMVLPGDHDYLVKVYMEYDNATKATGQ